MDVTVYSNARTFVDVARPVYAADPVRHTAALTALRSVERHGRIAVAAAVHHEGRLHGALVGDESFPIATSGLPGDAAPAVARSLADAGVVLDSVRGPRPEAAAFADAWSQVTGAEVAGSPSRWLYELGTLTEPNGVRGQAQLITDDDLPLLARWQEAFADELAAMAHGETLSSNSTSWSLDDGDRYGVWWVDGEPVTMALARRPESGMSRISYVYTPPEHRGHGYASALTAAVSRWVRDAGTPHVVLFADVDNPVSNRIYQRLGFRRRMEDVELSFRCRPARTLDR